MSKTCSTCGLSGVEFYKNKSTPDGLTYQCKDCHRKSTRSAFLKWQKTKKGKEAIHRAYINSILKESKNG